MKPKEFLCRIDNDRVVEAIADAETKTSGEIRVFVSRSAVPAPVTEATRQFARLGMAKTSERNAVLIFVAPASKTFAVIGDQGVHEKCGQEFWACLTEEMTQFFKKGDFTAGLIKGIETAGTLLSRHFPHRSDDKNELPNAIEGQ